MRPTWPFGTECIYPPPYGAGSEQLKQQFVSRADVRVARLWHFRDTYILTLQWGIPCESS